MTILFITQYFLVKYSLNCCSYFIFLYFLNFLIKKFSFNLKNLISPLFVKFSWENLNLKIANKNYKNIFTHNLYFHKNLNHENIYKGFLFLLHAYNYIFLPFYILLLENIYMVNHVYFYLKSYHLLNDFFLFFFLLPKYLK